MAYLRGGTVVDGPLYVEGDVKVKRVVIRDGEGYFPYVVDGSGNNPDVLVKFNGTSGDLADSNIKQEYINNSNNKDVKITLTSGNNNIVDSTSNFIIDLNNNNQLLIDVDPVKVKVQTGSFKAYDSSNTEVSNPTAGGVVDGNADNADRVIRWAFA